MLAEQFGLLHFVYENSASTVCDDMPIASASELFCDMLQFSKYNVSTNDHNSKRFYAIIVDKMKLLDLWKKSILRESEICLF